MTHTPGPWRAEHGSIKATNNYVVGKIDEPFHMHNETTEANARLIAAAPDLLAALRKVVAECVPVLVHLNLDTNDPAVRAIDRARAAIAKAEGKR